MVVDIKNYEGFYKIDHTGCVYSKRKIIKPYDNGHGYLAVQLWKNGKCKQFYIHRLVAAAFIPNPNNYREINHIDGDKTNNSVSNLEWCDRSINVKHAYDTGLKPKGEKHFNHKLTENQVAEIRATRGKITQRELANKYGVTQGLIYAIQTNKCWKM